MYAYYLLLIQACSLFNCHSLKEFLLILVTNDDGVYSPGIQLLAKRLKALDEVVIVAPDQIDPRLRWNMTASVAIEPR